MSQQSLTALVTNLRSQTETNSITPEILGNVLQHIVDEVGEIEAAQTAAQNGEFLFASLKGVRVPGATETEIVVNGSEVDYNTLSALLSFSSTDGTPILTAKRDCIVQITGQVNLQPGSSYTSDRVLRWFKVDGEGERYADSVMTTHFTGSTQIFNVPVNYSCFMEAGEVLHLTCFASGSNESIVSENSRINVHAYLKS